MRFTKMHGAGNDYIYIDARCLDKEIDWPSLSIEMSNRHTGIGSDGIILLQSSNRAHLRMSMFNADGSEGMMCGNGIRCLVAYAQKQAVIPFEQSPVMVETASGVLNVTPSMKKDQLVGARVKMGKPEFRATEIPVNLPNKTTVIDHPIKVLGYEFKINCVSMGNPHAVAFVDEDVDQIPLDTIGPIVENLPIFPKRVNFEIVNINSRKEVKARVWERGSGLTMACGTGACAIIAVAHNNQYVEDEVVVRLPGGELTILWNGQGDVILEGPVDEVFEGDWPV